MKLEATVLNSLASLIEEKLEAYAKLHRLPGDHKAEIQIIMAYVRPLFESKDFTLGLAQGLRAEYPGRYPRLKFIACHRDPVVGLYFYLQCPNLAKYGELE
jgi:hypothetical protein